MVYSRYYLLGLLFTLKRIASWRRIIWILFTNLAIFSAQAIIFISEGLKLALKLTAFGIKGHFLSMKLRKSIIEALDKRGAFSLLPHSKVMSIIGIIVLRSSCLPIKKIILIEGNGLITGSLIVDLAPSFFINRSKERLQLAHSVCDIKSFIWSFKDSIFQIFIHD